MQSFRASLIVFLSAALLASPAFATRTHRTVKSASSHRVHSTHGRRTAAHLKRSKRASHILHGQQAIEPERVTQIQEALIKAHYLNADANGEWDTNTVAAMQKYQADHGWQTKLMPDSRALKALGLGPDYSNALNAKDSSFGAPVPSADIPSVETAGFAAAAGVNR